MSQKLFYPHDFFNYSAHERTDSSETSVHTAQRHIPPKTPVFNDGGIVLMPCNGRKRKTSLIKPKRSLTIQCVF